MVNTRNDRLKRVKKRIKWKRKIWIHLLFIFFMVLIYFIFSSNIVIDEKTGWITIVKSIEKKEFTKIYTWSVLVWNVLDIDIDLKDVYLTWSLVNIKFSNNKEFKSLSIGWVNNYKVKFWYMLGKSRNKNEVFWIWKVTDSLKEFKHNVLDDNEDWTLWFRTANLEWWELFVEIKITWEKVIKKDSFKN